MQDLPKNILLEYYKDKTEQSINYLKEKYQLVICSKDDEDVPTGIKIGKNYKLYYKVKITILSKQFTLILAFPDFFPDVFPKIYLSIKDYQDIYPIPHLDNDRFICTSDPNVVSLNDKKPGKAVEELIKKAIEIIKEGINKENAEDFIEEFIAYWSNEADNTFLSIYEPGNDFELLYLFKLSEYFFGQHYILSKTEEELKRWLMPFGVELNSLKLKVLYIPTNKFNPFSLRENKDLLEILENYQNNKYFKSVEQYFNNNIDNSIICASFIIGENRILFGWKHLRGIGEMFKGFRNNRIPLNIRLITRNLPIKKNRIIRLDKERIFKRGGSITSLLKKDINLTLLGCGSIGSFLAMSLSRCGISNFELIDKEILSPENIPRHLCGMLEASKGMYKGDAIKKRLMEHFPYIECKVYDEDFLELIKERKLSFEKCDILIVALGDFSLERRINFLQRKGEINCPIIYLWIEPYGIGGHALYINPNDKGCFECCFNNDGRFKYSIVESEQVFEKRESGCQSTFIPYSSLNIEQFISIICKNIITILEKKLKESMLFTWIGDIEEFESFNFKISPMYSGQSPYTLIQKRSFQNEFCKICGKKV
jgi:Dinucleotide-utilizing enzymes involved in molybdopterin and thiamine biosynthesis family 2